MNKVTYLTYDRTVNYINDNIIDAEFTVIYDPSWVERASQIANYQRIQSMVNSKKTKKVIDFLA